MPAIRHRSKSRRSARPNKCMRPGPIGRNPYLNFLREFRKKCCGLTPTETIKQGARAWKKLPAAQKRLYIEKAFYAPMKRRASRYSTRPTGARVAKRAIRSKSRRRRSMKRNQSGVVCNM